MSCKKIINEEMFFISSYFLIGFESIMGQWKWDILKESVQLRMSSIQELKSLNI